LLLPLEISAENTIGFNDVTGYYGPGAFVAWLLVLFTCYYHLTRRINRTSWPVPFESVTLFLLSLNGSAIDLFNRLKLIDSLADDPIGARQQGAPLAAAVIFTHLGLIHGLVLICLESVANGTGIPAPTSKLVCLLCVGLLLPSASLTLLAVSLTQQGGTPLRQVIDSTPVFYTTLVGGSDHRGILKMSIMVAPLSLVLILGLLGVYLDLTFPGIRVLLASIARVVRVSTLPDTAARTPSLRRPPPTRWSLIWAARMYVVPLVTIVIVAVTATLITTTHGIWLLYELAIFAVYRTDKKCYFMPCTPQKITEMDQLGALVMGCFGVALFELRLHRRLLTLGRRTIRRTSSSGDVEWQAGLLQPLRMSPSPP
jgi:hypothetical protein